MSWWQTALMFGCYVMIAATLVQIGQGVWKVVERLSALHNQVADLQDKLSDEAYRNREKLVEIEHHTRRTAQELYEGDMFQKLHMALNDAREVGPQPDA